jgi:hypothetical protein
MNELHLQLLLEGVLLIVLELLFDYLPQEDGILQEISPLMEVYMNHMLQIENLDIRIFNITGVQ